MRLPLFKIPAAATREILGSELTVISGWPETARLGLAFELMTRLVMRERPIQVVFFALRLSRRAIVRRFTVNTSGGKLRSCSSSAPRTPRTLWQGPIYIKPRRRLPVLEMWFIARRLDRELRATGKRLGLIFIDDLSAIPGRSYARKLEELKLFAREMQVPVVVLARLSRRGESAARIRAPQTSDLDHWEIIRKHADRVVIAYQSPDSLPDDFAEVIVPKPSHAARVSSRLARGDI